MPSKPKPRRPRTERRQAARAAASAVKDRERLFELEPGGSARLPIEVPSSSVVESRAAAIACPQCGGEHLVEEHAAVTGDDGARLREAKVRCRRCGSKRAIWFRLTLPN